KARGAFAFARMLRHARPFFQRMFFDPMDRIDPSGKRMIEAFRHMQRLGEKPTAKRRAFGRFLQSMSDLFNHPVLGKMAGPVAEWATGVDGRYIAILNTPSELLAARGKTFDELANDALSAKED